MRIWTGIKQAGTVIRAASQKIHRMALVLVIGAVVGVVATPSTAQAAGFACQNRDTGDVTHFEWLARRWCLYPNDAVASPIVDIGGGVAFNYILKYQSDGNIVLYGLVYTNETRTTAIWAFNMIDPHYASYPRGYLAMQTDGNLVLYDGRGTPRFQSNTYRCNRSASLRIQNDSNAVIYRDSAGPNFNPTPSAATWKIEGANHRLVHLAC
jgi:hypothetical protein